MWQLHIIVHILLIIILIQQSLAAQELNEDALDSIRFIKFDEEQKLIESYQNEYEDNSDCENCNCVYKRKVAKSIGSIDIEYYRKNCDCENCDCGNCDCENCDCENCDYKKKGSYRMLPPESEDMYDYINNNFLSVPLNMTLFAKPDIYQRSIYGKVIKTFKTFIRNIFDDVPAEIKCESCVAIVDILLEFRKGFSKGELHVLLKELCHVVSTKNFCEGILNLHLDLILYILKSRPNLTGETICNINGQSLGCFIPRESEKFNSWKIDIQPPLKTFNPNNDNHNLSDHPIKILQISDIHYDPEYKKGGNTKCEEPLCCRNYDFKILETSIHSAGKWGHYKKCDTPIELVYNLMQEVSKHDIDFVYFIGDIIPHNVWETSRESNSETIKTIYKLFYSKFVVMNIPVYPILGNHEFHPLDSNAPKDVPEEFSQQWLFDLVAEYWSLWLPEDTIETIKQGGFYTVVPKPGFRIIALNSNMAYVYNWWLLYNDTDPYGQLQWLADTLYLAEQNNEKVHILSHVPPGEKDTYAKWAYEYNNIIYRFAHIINGQFCGHTHNVQMYYYYADNKIEKPVNIMYNGGSIATYQNNNPNYRVYDVHPITMAVENFYDWSFNLTEANKIGQPQWVATNFKYEFGLQSMSYAEMGQLAFKMVTDKYYMETYFRLKNREGDTSLQNGCDNRCMMKNLCSIFMTVADDDGYCNYFKKIFNKNIVKD